MTRRNFPRLIAPELVRAGDKISVRYPERSGITNHMEGVVARVVEQGATRAFVTSENATIGKYMPGFDNEHITITLLDRPNHPQTTLFD